MTETLPTEAPYTLRDILDFLNSRIQLAHALKRSSEIMQPRYSTAPGCPPLSQFLVDRYAVSRLMPAPVRMDFETAIALKLFHRLEKASKKWYHSELNPQKFAMIVVRVLEGSGRTLDQAWGMSVETFDSWWLERIKMKKGKRIGLPSNFPSSVLEWLTSKYLSHPTPDAIFHPALADKLVVYERLESFTDYLRAHSLPVASTLEALGAACLTADMRFDLYGDGPTTDGIPVPSSISRLKLPPGSYRILAISVDVFEASKTCQSQKGQPNHVPKTPSSKGGKRPLTVSNPLLVNFYDSVLAECHEGKRRTEVVAVLQANRDLVGLARKLGRTLDMALIRAAKKYRDDNPK